MQLIDRDRYRPKLFFVSLLLLTALVTENSTAAWVNKGIPNPHVINFALSPGSPATLFATATNTSAGVWRSIDSGDNWLQVDASGTFDGVAANTAPTPVVLAGVAGNSPAGGIFRSDANGDPATFSATAGSFGHTEWKFAFSKSSPAVVYAGGFTANGNGRMQKSTDSGASWTSLPIAGDASPAIVSLAVHPTDPNIVYAGAQPGGALNDGLYKSVDGGANWTFLSNLNSNITFVSALAIDPNDPQLIYAGTVLNKGDIYRSIDGGTNWTKVHDPFAGAGNVANFTAIGEIVVDPGNSQIIYAVGGPGGVGNPKVIASTDCGATWTDQTSTGIPDGQVPKKLLIDTDNDFIYVLDDLLGGVIFRDAAITTGTGACPGGTTGGGGSGGGGSGGGAGSENSGESSSSSGSFGFSLLVLFQILIVSRFLIQKNIRVRA